MIVRLTVDTHPAYLAYLLSWSERCRCFGYVVLCGLYHSQSSFGWVLALGAMVDRHGSPFRLC